MYRLKINLPFMLLSVNVRCLSETPGFQRITYAIHNIIIPSCTGLVRAHHTMLSFVRHIYECTLYNLPPMDGRTFACLLLCSGHLQLDLLVDLVYDCTIPPPLPTTDAVPTVSDVEAKALTLDTVQVDVTLSETENSLSWSTLWVQHMWMDGLYTSLESAMGRCTLLVPQVTVNGPKCSSIDLRGMSQDCLWWMEWLTLSVWW